MNRTLLWSVVVGLSTVAALAAVVSFGNVGASRWTFAALLAVPLTIGLPSTLAALLCVSLWHGPPLWGFGAVVLVAAVFGQWSAFVLVRRLWRRGRR